MCSLRNARASASDSHPTVPTSCRSALVIAEPGRGWSRVRVLATRHSWTTKGGEVVERLEPMTAPSNKELLDAAAAMKVQVTGRHYVLSHKKRLST